MVVKDEICIRRAVRSDLSNVVRLLSLLYSAPERGTHLGANIEKAWLEILADKRQFVLVAARERNVVGTCTLIIISNLTRGGRPIGFLENVAVEPGIRRTGVGTLLVSGAVSRAWDHGCYKVLVSSGARNSAAHEFFGRLGFRGDSKRAFEIRAPAGPSSFA
jgi:N-acetylglutamate synthase-like GNAT family acetyltransferase